jgi:hypothetical protein
LIFQVELTKEIQHQGERKSGITDDDSAGVPASRTLKNHEQSTYSRHFDSVRQISVPVRHNVIVSCDALQPAMLVRPTPRLTNPIQIRTVPASRARHVGALLRVIRCDVFRKKGEQRWQTK